MLTVQSFFDVSEFDHEELFPAAVQVWQPLNNLKEYMDNFRYPELDRAVIADGVPLTKHVVYHDGSFYAADETFLIKFGDTTKGKLEVRQNGNQLAGASVIMAGAVLLGNEIGIGKGVLVETGAMIKSPAIIGDCTEVRQGSYLRGYCLAGKRCVLGHTTEIKHSIFLNDAKAGHFAYLGDSILGGNANLGAGTKFANLRFIGGNINIIHDGKRYDTGRRKLGAILGDNCQTGCNSVTSPGTLMGKSAMLMPNTTAKAGYFPDRMIIRQ